MTGFATDAIHAGYEPDSLYGPINTPIYASTTFAQDGLAELRGGYEYTRVGNPTVTALEKAVAALEGAEYAVAYSSGMAAIDVILRILLKPGDHIVVSNDAYGGTYRLIQQVFTQWGVENTVVDMTNPDEVAAAVKDNTKAIWVETPTNPMLDIVDIEAIAAVKQQAALVVDNTFASPYLQKPFDLGADVVVHSTTKYIGGHSDVIGGALVIPDAALAEQVKFQQFAAGAVNGPMDAYLTTRGLKTLGVRMDRHQANAQAVAEWLTGRAEVSQVLYPGLPDHPGHELAQRQMRGFGGMVSLRLSGGAAAARRVAESTRLFQLAESLGGIESLMNYPAEMTHASVAGTELAVPDDLLRLSVGIEDAEDLVADLERALGSL